MYALFLALGTVYVKTAVLKDGHAFLVHVLDPKDESQEDASEEVDIESWYEQMMVAIEPPEDWSGSLDIERQDYGVDLEENFHLGFENPLDTFDER